MGEGRNTAGEAAPRDVTRLLQEWNAGHEDALERLMPLVYRELRALAARYMARERSGHTLQPTALVHEAYLRLTAQHSVDWRNRAHFYGIAARLMRRILVDRARRASRSKRGGAMLHVALDGVPVAAEAPLHPVDAVVLDEALRRLEAIDPQQARVVELRYFGGLTLEETAEVLGVSTGTVKRHWSVARAWLYRAIMGVSPG